MPQLDFSYYISQITWLLIGFGGFFCVSKFIILPQLERILFARSNLIDVNTKFTQETIDKANRLNRECDDCLDKNKQETEQKIANFIEKLNETTDQKVKQINKRLIENENKEILKMKNEIENAKTELIENIAISVVEIIEKFYSLKADKNKIKSYIKDIKV